MPVIDLGSVVGPQGPQGATGATGAQGIQGNPGPNQVTDQTSTNLNGVLFGNQSRVTVKPVDSAPTADSTNLVSSGGTNKAIKGRVPVYGMGVNLLRNAYFVGGGTGRGVFPVNQRGLSSYSSGSSSIFGADGWYVYSNSTLTLTQSGMQLSNNGTVVQDMPKNDALFGKSITLTIFTSLGLFVATGAMPNAVPSTMTNVCTITNSNEFQLILRMAPSGKPSLAWFSYDGNVTYYAMKLETGTEQTLCHNEGTDANPVWVLNEVPDYEYELYRCMTSTADSSDTYANKTLATREELAVTSDNVTFSNNVTGYTYQNEFHLSKSGKVVVTNIYMSASSISGLGTILCTVPAAFRPSINRRVATWMTYNNESKVETVFINSNGEVTTAAGSSSISGFIRIFGTYIL